MQFRRHQHTKQFGIVCGLACLCIFALVAVDVKATEPIARYNVVWDSPSKDMSGQMPLGNGDIAAGVYAIEDGDLYLLLAKNDAYTYNGDIFKTGRVRISLDPNPFELGKSFRQTLDLATASVRIEADGVQIKIWADANRPVYHVQIDSPGEITVTADSDLWERFDSCSYNVSKEPIDKPTQDVRLLRGDKILWYYAVGDRSVFPTEMDYYEVPEMTSQFADPYRHNTFGNLLESSQLSLDDGLLQGKGKRFDIRIHSLTMQTPEISKWIETIEQQASNVGDVATDRAEHCQWWSDFWNRSWIVVSDSTLPLEDREKLDGEATGGRRMETDGGALVAQSYNVFRYLMACQSRGRVQAKFNGGLFTQPLKMKGQRGVATQLPDGTWMRHEDDRDWGRRFTFQNQRLLYWPLLMSGDGDLMQPFFDFYSDLLPVRRAITKAWFGHEGAYYRENIEPTGGERDCGRSGKPPKTPPGENQGKGYYHSYYFTSGLETLVMMIDYVNYSGDEQFRDETLVPFARDVLLFFDKHYPRDEDGKVRLDPAMVLETWWIAVNPAPDVAGLQFCLDELLAMKAGAANDIAVWQRFRAELPEIHLHELDGRKAIAPAQSWSAKHNSENGELYPVFPFRCFGLGLGTADIVDWTMKYRSCKNSFGYKCWTQDQIHYAYAGRAAEAQDGLVHRFRHATTQCRFPLFGSPGPDACPDFDHFGAGSTALQRMLVQEANGKILLFPAWPADWDVDFKLHVAGGGTVQGKVVDGEMIDWSIEPTERKNDVIVYPLQTSPAIPANNFPLRIGADQTGKNQFRGQIGRLSMFRGLIDQETIQTLAEGDRTKKLTADEVVTSVIDPKAGDSITIEADDLAGSVSFEMWICPAKGEAGRIIDKLTPGQRDGFLLDCWPSQALRLIVGGRQEDYLDKLTADQWHHVVIQIAKGKYQVYLDGERI